MMATKKMPRQLLLKSEPQQMLGKAHVVVVVPRKVRQWTQAKL
jgi:hypothetical protein